MPDEVIARLAGRQHGLVTIAQLLAAGLDHSAIRRRVRRGVLHRVARGVYAVGHVALSREATFLAAVLEAGKGAALGYLAATEHREVRKYRAPLIDVVVPSRRRVQTATRIHRTTLHPSDVTIHKGIPVTTIARTLVDLTGIEVDFHWPENRLVVEVDGPGHDRPRTKRDDERKQALLEAAGSTVIRIRDVSALRAARPARP